MAKTPEPAPFSTEAEREAIRKTLAVVFEAAWHDYWMQDGIENFNPGTLWCAIQMIGFHDEPFPPRIQAIVDILDEYWGDDIAHHCKSADDD